MNKNQTNTTSNTIFTASASSSDILSESNDSGSATSKNKTQQSQLMECLEKLDLILANQNHLENVIVSQVAILASRETGAVNSEVSLNA